MNEPIDKIFTTESQQLEQASKRVVNTILGINNESEQLIETLTTRITTQKNIIDRLEKDLVKLDKKSRKLKSGPESEAAKAQLQEAKQMLEEEKKALINLESQLNIVSESIYQLVNVQKTLNAKMTKMKSSNQEDSAQFTEMTKLADEVKKTLQELNSIIYKMGGHSL